MATHRREVFCRVVRFLLSTDLLVIDETGHNNNSHSSSINSSSMTRYKNCAICYHNMHERGPEPLFVCQSQKTCETLQWLLTAAAVLPIRARSVLVYSTTIINTHTS